MTSEELRLLLSRLSVANQIPRDDLKRGYLSVIKRLIRAEFTSDQIYVMVSALVRDQQERDKWIEKQAKGTIAQRIARLFRT